MNSLILVTIAFLLIIVAANNNNRNEWFKIFWISKVINVLKFLKIDARKHTTDKQICFVCGKKCVKIILASHENIWKNNDAWILCRNNKCLEYLKLLMC